MRIHHPSARSRLLAATLLATLSFAGTARAGDPPPPDGVWTGKGQGGLLFSSGNSVSNSFNAKLDLARTDGPWKNGFALAGLYGKNNGILSAERVEGRYELDHKISDRLYWFAAAAGTRDLFSGFNYQVNATAGLGYKIIDSADTKLDGSLGVGAQRLQTQQIFKDAAGAVIQRINGNAQTSMVGTAGLNYEHKLTSSTKLTDKLLITSGSLDTLIANDLGLQVAMNETLALSIGYSIRDNTKPASGVKKLDQVTTVNLVYNIK